MSGGALGTGVVAAMLIYGGAWFARFGWRALRSPAAPVLPGRELAPPPPGASLPWKLLWIFMLSFGAFTLICGLFLALSIFLPE